MGDTTWEADPKGTVAPSLASGIIVSKLSTEVESSSVFILIEEKYT